MWDVLIEQRAYSQIPAWGQCRAGANEGLCRRVLQPQLIRAACTAAGYSWRDRLLDPVLTVHLFVLQVPRVGRSPLRARPTASRGAAR